MLRRYEMKVPKETFKITNTMIDANFVCYRKIHYFSPKAGEIFFLEFCENQSQQKSRILVAKWRHSREELILSRMVDETAVKADFYEWIV